MNEWKNGNAISQRTKVAAEIRDHAPNIEKITEEVLADMYCAQQLVGTASDQPINIDTLRRISIAQGAQINQIVRRLGISKSLEIGFAYGFSTVWILDGLRPHVKSLHLAIDPFEITKFDGIGLYQVKRLGVASSFEWIGEYSIHALSRLIKSGDKFDFIFIDGDHHFDNVLVDFYLSDQLVSSGGLLAFDDMWMPSVRTVVSFILTNRQYKIVPQPVRNMIVLKKITDDNRDWLHFEIFKVSNQKREQRILRFKEIVLKIARATGTDEILGRMRSKYRSKSRL
jgi:predicted O-methyltransferase YrrM